MLYDRDNDVSSAAGSMQVPECGDQEIEWIATPEEHGAGKSQRGRLRIRAWALSGRIYVKGEGGG
jgi:hypothetical protein